MMSTTEARAQYGAILKALAELTNQHVLEGDLLARDPVLVRVLWIRNAADGLIRAALAAAAPSPADPWQPIESAPKDPRTRVLLKWVSGQSVWICIGAWDSVENRPSLETKGCPREGWLPDGGTCIPVNQKCCVSFMPLPAAPGAQPAPDTRTFFEHRVDEPPPAPLQWEGEVPQVEIDRARAEVAAWPAEIRAAAHVTGVLSGDVAARTAQGEVPAEPSERYDWESRDGKQHDTGRVTQGPRRSFFADTASPEDAKTIADALNAFAAQPSELAQARAAVPDICGTCDGRGCPTCEPEPEPNEPDAWLHTVRQVGDGASDTPDLALSFTKDYFPLAGIWESLKAEPLYLRAVAPEAVTPDELSPDFTDTARAALLWVLWHHQGGNSPVGQPIRYALGMGAHDRLNEHQIAEAKRWAALSKSTTEEFHRLNPASATASSADARDVANGDTARLEWLLPNLHPATWGMEFEGGYEWSDDAEFLRKWRKAIDGELQRAAIAAAQGGDHAA